jgi:hypothetical protein
MIHRGKRCITCMLGYTNSIEPTLPLAELGSRNKERRQNTENELRAALSGMQGYHK